MSRIEPGSFDELLERFRAFAVFLPGLAYPPPARCRDRKDDYLLEQALRFAAEVLVTGDDDLLALDGHVDGLRILRPRALLDEFTQAS
jgi:predicted nucleic acid-binding protein